jgi:hypothetical protein
MFSIWQIDEDTKSCMPSGRFPSPWSVEDIGAAFVVKDSSGQKLGYFYYEEEPLVDFGGGEHTPTNGVLDHPPDEAKSN